MGYAYRSQQAVGIKKHVFTWNSDQLQGIALPKTV